MHSDKDSSDKILIMYLSNDVVGEFNMNKLVEEFSLTSAKVWLFPRTEISSNTLFAFLIWWYV